MKIWWIFMIIFLFYILLRRKCIKEDTGDNVIRIISYSIFKVAAYACVLCDTFSLQEHIDYDIVLYLLRGAYNCGCLLSPATAILWILRRLSSRISCNRKFTALVAVANKFVTAIVRVDAAATIRPI